MSKIQLLVISIILILSISTGCTKKTPTENTVPLETGNITDIDGNVYKTVKIGEQWWTAENLKVTHYRDGSEILKVEDAVIWSNLTSGAYCSYDNDDTKIGNYGCLYNWYAVTDSRLISPPGWRVPIKTDWEALIEYLGEDASDKMKEPGTEYWLQSNSVGTNESGLSVIPAGDRYNHGIFVGLNLEAAFWTTTESEYLSSHAASYIVYNGVSYFGMEKYFGFSVRLIKE